MPIIKLPCISNTGPPVAGVLVQGQQPAAGVGHGEVQDGAEQAHPHTQVGGGD